MTIRNWPQFVQALDNEEHGENCAAYEEPTLDTCSCGDWLWVCNPPEVTHHCDCEAGAYCCEAHPEHKPNHQPA